MFVNFNIFKFDNQKNVILIRAMLIVFEKKYPLSLKFLKIIFVRGKNGIPMARSIIYHLYIYIASFLKIKDILINSKIYIAINMRCLY